MKKIMTIVGARPQFVKAAVLSRAFKNISDVEEVLVHTGQHYDPNMSDVFFEEMQIPTPKYNLGVNGMNHGEMTGQMLGGIEQLILDENPDMLLVYGDTNSTLAGALAAQKLGVPVAHIEAGLRSFNMKMPEEVNRILTDRISSMLFCPTETAIENLKKEGYENFNIAVHRTGDVMYDAAMYYKAIGEGRSTVMHENNLQEGKFVLCTLHRQENTDDPTRMKEILAGIDKICEETQVIWPQHPRTKKVMENAGLSTKALQIEPVGYYDMIALLDACKLVVTDSGGLQKEAYFFEKPCITARDQTEWTELVKAGYNTLVGADSQRIFNAYDCFTESNMKFEKGMYGDGEAGAEIVNEILSFLSTK